VLIITFPITKDFTPVAPYVATSAMTAAGLSGAICLGRGCYKLIGYSRLEPDWAVNAFGSKKLT
jgi:hypothetical protein